MTLLKGFHKHHIIPRHAGGSDDESNLVLLHPIDHAIVHLVRYRMSKKISDLRSANVLLEHIDGSAFSYECNAGENNPNYGNKMSVESRARISAARKGSKQSAETIAKRVAKNTGQKRPNQSIAISGIRNPNYGKPMSPETKAKMIETKKLKFLAKKDLENA